MAQDRREAGVLREVNGAGGEPEAHGRPDSWERGAIKEGAAERPPDRLSERPSFEQLVSLLGHELRSPLAAALVQVEVPLANPRLDEATRRALARARSQIVGLDRVVAHLVSLHTDGGLCLRREPADFGAIVEELVERIGVVAPETRGRIRTRIERRLHGAWDRVAVERIVENLISNALKFGDQREIDVEVDRARLGARLRVRDEGIGIAPEHHARIFERFVRVVPPRSYGGLGLGLWVVRRLAEAHGGRVAVESQLGAGTTFEVLLPG